MRKIIFLLVFIFVSKVNAQNYNVTLIPDSLIKNAHIVKRMEELHVTIKALNKVVVTNKYAITILDEQGDDAAEYFNSYSSMRNLSSIEGNLYDALGRKLKSIKKRDIQDIPASDGFSLALDNRYKKHNFYCKQYPYTVEYSDEMEINNSYFLPSWEPIEADHYSVQQSRFIVETNPDYELRIKPINLKIEPEISITKTKQYSWELKNLTAIESEPLQPQFKELVPMIYIGASDFMLGSYTGDMRTWLSFGKLNNNLNKGRDEIPEKIKSDIHKIVDGITDQAEKVKVLYQYMQQNTRYISVQLGIGGWQPFDAKYVAENKYGDCKALSNFMVSILKEVGIKANYVVARAGAGEKGLNEEFPSASYFNHVIACVPNGKDTIWLECTNQTNPAGYMGSFTGNRKVLLIDEDGGHIVQTPTYSSDDNMQTRKTVASIKADGTMVADIKTRSTGEQQELQHHLIHDYTKEEREKYLNTSLNLSTYEVDQSTYSEIPGIIPVIDEHLHVQATGFATTTGKRLFFSPNFVNQSKTRLSTDSTRKYPIHFSSSFKDIDTIYLELPENYQIESIPKSENIHSQFGNFEMKFKVTNNKVEVIRTQTRNRADYPSTDYAELVTYFDKIYKADHSKIVFVLK